MPALLQIDVEVPHLAFLHHTALARSHIERQVGLHLIQLDYRPDQPDVWLLSPIGAPIEGTLAIRNDIPHLQCEIRLPSQTSMVLYRCAILKTGTVLDSAGKQRDPTLHATEEEIFFCIVNDDERHYLATQPLLVGVHYIFLPPDAIPYGHSSPEETL